MGSSSRSDKIGTVSTFYLLSAALALATAWWAETRDVAGSPAFLAPAQHPLRQATAMGIIAFALWMAVYLPMGSFGKTPVVNTEDLSVASLFFVQTLLLMTVVWWWLTRWVGVTPLPGPVSRPLSHSPTAMELQSAETAGGWLKPRLACLGLAARRPLRELALGLVAGFFAWGGVLLAVVAVAGVAIALGGEAWVSEPPSEIIVWMVELGIGTRLLISLSAGVTEEIFFRGYLQPRLGIWASTLCFIAAHASYGRPLMLVGVGLLSLLYGLLSRWRGNIWASISAHFLFDAVQLLVVIPAALRASEGIC